MAFKKSDRESKLCGIRGSVSIEMAADSPRSFSSSVGCLNKWPCRATYSAPSPSRFPATKPCLGNPVSNLPAFFDQAYTKVIWRPGQIPL